MSTPEKLQFNSEIPYNGILNGVLNKAITSLYTWNSQGAASYCMLTDSEVSDVLSGPRLAWRGCACASVSRFGCEVRLRDPCAVLCNYPVCVPAPPGPKGEG